MKRKTAGILFPILMIITLFSLWAGFALLFVNQILYKDLPGYTMGRLCIWELVAFLFAILITKFVIKKWGNIDIREIDGQLKLTLNLKYGIYFSIYFLIAIIVGIWQFWVFSHKF